MKRNVMAPVPPTIMDLLSKSPTKASRREASKINANVDVRDAVDVALFDREYLVHDGVEPIGHVVM